MNGNFVGWKLHCAFPLGYGLRKWDTGIRRGSNSDRRLEKKYFSIECKLAGGKGANATSKGSEGARNIREDHKIFDEVVINVRAGKGGNGEIVEKGKGRFVKNFKYNPGGNSPKKLWLPASAPADGLGGGDVVLFCDPALDSLLHLHEKSMYTSRSGANGNPENGSQSPKRMKREKRKAPPLRIGVPPGTVVKRKGTGRFLGELISPGDRLVVARGGEGGLGVVKPSRKEKTTATKKHRKMRASGVDIIEVEDNNWKDDTRGGNGQEVSLQLLLRIVADVGFVGLPNAGKSSLLSDLTRARPEIAPYPFTTLVPNLGVMGRGGDPVLVDLPGLIEGAHIGRGLGRNFLRHLRRTRVLLQVVDGSSPDPVGDYITIREELRMYNPEYCKRPHIVALNKMDLPDSYERKAESLSGIDEASKSLKEKFKDTSLPSAILAVSALDGTGVEDLRNQIEKVIGQLLDGMDKSDFNVDDLLGLDIDESALEEESWGNWGEEEE